MEGIKMKCPNCQFENPEGMLFCGKCGTKLERICPKCNFPNPFDFMFCGKCATSLEQPKEIPPVDYDQPKSYTPHFLADKILTTRSSIEGERKLVTVLFADVANYTSISEKLDPEEVHQVMNGCFKILMDEIHRHEGTINQFTGDGVMALFGAPLAQEEHAQKACHTALSIQKSLSDYAEKIKKDYRVDFQMRIGLNSGPVVVGSIGDDLRMDYTAVGDTTNLASRMESMARPGTILVSQNTYRLTKDFFEFKPLGEIEVKGKEYPQEAFELTKVSEVETRIEAAVAKGLTRFVGRKNSMAALVKACDKVHSGSGQVVAIVGEAGVGKSRLLMEFKNQLSQSEYTYLEGRCLHYGGSMPYLPMLDILRSYFDIKGDDLEHIIKEKMSERVLELDERLKAILPSFQEILSLKVEDEAYLNLEPGQKKERTFEAFRNLFVQESQTKTLVLAIEDLHWIDKTSEEYLDYLIGWLANAKILLVLLYRPEYTHQWGSKSFYNRIGLDQLTARSSTELVQAILEGGQVTPDLRELILGRASGNPLYMEELTQTLLENGSIQKKGNQYVLSSKASEILIPDTIHGIISARMDRLEDNLKRIMQVASVIGRDFAFRILQAITGSREELKAYLLNLQGLEFIYEKRLFPELEYIFKHALIQEVAYNSLLQKRRQEIHEKIGKAIEQIYKNRLEEFYEMLAYHYLKAANHMKAYQYLIKAGDAAARLYAYAESRLHYAMALEAIAHLPDTEDNHRRRVDTLIKQAGSSWRADPLEQNLSRLIEAERLAKELPSPDGTPKGDQLRLARIHYWIGRVYYVSNKMPEAIGYFNQVLEEAGDLDEPELLVTPSLTIGAIMLVQGQLDKAMTVLSRAIVVSEQMGKWPEWCRAVGYNGIAMAMSGDCAAGVAEVQRAIARAKEISSLAEISMTTVYLSVASIFAGDLPQAIEAGRRAVEAGEESKERIYVCLGNAWKGWAESRSGDFEAAKVSMARSLIVQDELGGQVIAADWIAAINAEVAFGIGRIEEALRLAEQAIGIAQKMDGIFAEGLARQVQGQALAALDPPRWDEAEAQLKESLCLLESGQNQVEAARTHLAWGSVCLERGNHAAAHQHWELAAVQFEASDLLQELRQIHARLADLGSKYEA
jgi:class 3 adenylate cyclase/tetratricopeptide (TPR) repeat protein